MAVHTLAELRNHRLRDEWRPPSNYPIWSAAQYRRATCHTLLYSTARFASDRGNTCRMRHALLRASLDKGLDNGFACGPQQEMQ